MISDFLFSYLFLGFLLVLTIIYIFISHRRKLKLMKKDIEIYYMNKYKKIAEKSSEDMRQFISEATNIMDNFKELIDNDRFEELEKYVDLVVAPIKDDIAKDYVFIKKLAYIKDMKIKGILYQKIIQAKALNLNIMLDMSSEIETVPINALDLNMILGNLLDNAIEASEQSNNKILYIGLYQGFVQKYDRDITVIRISNSCKEVPAVHKIYDYGYSTKTGNERGTGLFGVKKILSKYDNCALESFYNDDTELFTQEIKIFN